MKKKYTKPSALFTFFKYTQNVKKIKIPKVKRAQCDKNNKDHTKYI